jgi:two-component system KDP operon response regulator KdpE
LVVDDELESDRVPTKTLEEHGYSVVVTNSSQECLKRLREERFQVVLINTGMPNTDGARVCEAIRKTSATVIVVLTSIRSEAAKVCTLNAGADDYITKPFSIPELLARFRSHIRRTQRSYLGPPRLISFDEVEINVATRHVLVAGRDVRFSPKEFDLLYYFATHPNVVIPHSELLQAMWGPDYVTRVEYLHVYINQIRRKLQGNSSGSCRLRTELRSGYRLCLEC